MCPKSVFSFHLSVSCVVSDYEPSCTDFDVVPVFLIPVLFADVFWRYFVAWNFFAGDHLIFGRLIKAISPSIISSTSMIRLLISFYLSSMFKPLSRIACTVVSYKAPRVPIVFNEVLERFDSNPYEILRSERSRTLNSTKPEPPTRLTNDSRTYLKHFQGFNKTETSAA